MSTDNLPISQIMVPVYEAVVERLKGSISNRVQSGFREIGELALQKTLIDRDPSNDPISPVVVCAFKARRKANETLSFQAQQEFPAGHITKLAVGLHPVPMLAEHSRNIFAPPAPIGTNDGLDLGKIVFSNCSFAKRERQHNQRIAKQSLGRQLKLHEQQKNLLRTP